MNETGGFQCLEHSNWTICSLYYANLNFSPDGYLNFSPLRSCFVLTNFHLSHLHAERSISITPEGYLPTSDKTEGFRCIGHSNLTICSPLSQHRSDKFHIVHIFLGGEGGADLGPLNGKVFNRRSAVRMAVRFQI